MLMRKVHKDKNDAKKLLVTLKNLKKIVFQDVKDVLLNPTLEEAIYNDRVMGAVKRAFATHKTASEDILSEGSALLTLTLKRQKRDVKIICCLNCQKLLKKNNRKVCSRCWGVAYCSESCQVQHWKAGHKKSCKSLKSASANTINVEGI